MDTIRIACVAAIVCGLLCVGKTFAHYGDESLYTFAAAENDHAIDDVFVSHAANVTRLGLTQHGRLYVQTATECREQPCRFTTRRGPAELTFGDCNDGWGAAVLTLDWDSQAEICLQLLHESHVYHDGPVGPPGRDGVDGADSTVPGPPGRDGVDGADSTVPGPPGRDGVDGADSTVPGPPGRDGVDGADSTVPGPPGRDGVDGADSTVSTRPRNANPGTKWTAGLQRPDNPAIGDLHLDPSGWVRRWGISGWESTGVNIEGPPGDDGRSPPPTVTVPTPTWGACPRPPDVFQFDSHGSLIAKWNPGTLRGRDDNLIVQIRWTFYYPADYSSVRLRGTVAEGTLSGSNIAYTAQPYGSSIETARANYQVECRTS